MKRTQLDDKIEYLYGLKRFGVRMDLAMMQRLMDALGNPEQKFKAVHIAGTNGKGSTAAMLDRVLREAGYRVGLYTSPYLEVFNERIRLDGENIDDVRLGELIARVRVVVEKYGLEPTFFEFVTALAFVEFAETGLDIAVIETGMGGLLDATNVVPVPEVAVITNIGLDHMDILGATKQEIAMRKSGIIKQGGVFVTGEKDAALLEYFRKVCEELNASMRVTKAHFVKGFELGLLGDHQKDNAAVVVGVVAALREQGWDISDVVLRRGLATVRWPGRLDVVSQNPFVVVDGAHNDDGVIALSAWLDHFPLSFIRKDKSILLLAMKEGKDLGLMTDLIVRRFGTVIVTEGNYMPMNANHLASSIRDTFPDAVVIVESDVKKAIVRANDILELDGFMLVTGSLYMIGDALKELRRSVV